MLLAILIFSVLSFLVILLNTKTVQHEEIKSELADIKATQSQHMNKLDCYYDYLEEISGKANSVADNSRLLFKKQVELEKEFEDLKQSLAANSLEVLKMRKDVLILKDAEMGKAQALQECLQEDGLQEAKGEATT